MCKHELGDEEDRERKGGAAGGEGWKKRCSLFDRRRLDRAQESEALQREETEGGGSNVYQHLLFTPFFPLRSFLYCSLSLVIRPGSTSQASETGPCSSLSTRGGQKPDREAVEELHESRRGGPARLSQAHSFT